MEEKSQHSADTCNGCHNLDNFGHGLFLRCSYWQKATATSSSYGIFRACTKCASSTPAVWEWQVCASTVVKHIYTALRCSPRRGQSPATKPVDADHASKDGSAPSETYSLKGLTTCLQRQQFDWKSITTHKSKAGSTVPQATSQAGQLTLVCVQFITERRAGMRSDLSYFGVLRKSLVTRATSLKVLPSVKVRRS